MIVVEIREENISVRRWSIEDIAEAVYTLVQLIPIGCVTTYKEIAKVLGISPRLVAKILSKNKKLIAIPCHRVVKSNGELGGYTLNGKNVPKFKESLLKLEGYTTCKYKLSRLLNIE